jgi:putative ABC transport system permease protein
VLSQFFGEGVPLALAQAAVVTLLALAVMLLARWQDIHVEGETVIALARGFVQILAVGSVLLVLLQGPQWTSILVLIGMMLAAASIAARRAKGIPGAFRVSLAGIGLGSGIVIVLMTFVGVIDSAVSSLIPVGSIVIANAMNTNALALERFRSDVTSHVGQIETALALGAEAKHTVQPYVQAAVQASLIPRLDSLASLGIVWIPGLMAGMILSGTDPVYAAIYQFVVIAMIYAAAGLTSLISALLIRSRAFSPAEQLVLRPASR